MSVDLLNDEAAAGEVFECIGSFLWNAGLITSDAEGHNFCHKLIAKIRGTVTNETEELSETCIHTLESTDAHNAATPSLPHLDRIEFILARA